MHDLKDPLAPDEADPSGKWNWRLNDLLGGIVDVVWDLAEPSTIQAATAGGRINGA
jgi:hypothetical protein